MCLICDRLNVVKGLNVIGISFEYVRRKYRRFTRSHPNFSRHNFSFMLTFGRNMGGNIPSLRNSIFYKLWFSRNVFGWVLSLPISMEKEGTHGCRTISGERERERNLLNRGESVAVKEFQLEYYPLGNQNGRRFTGWSVSTKNDEHLDLCLITVRCPSVPIFP